MQEVLRRERCPRCAALGRDKHADNMAVYADGHKYCFAGCGIIEWPTTFERIKGTLCVTNKSVTLPWDVTNTIDMKPLLWLSNYDITREELILYELKWSSSKQHLIFPFFDDQHHLLAYQARDFNPTPKTKWFSSGDIHEIIPFNLTKKRKGGIIIVEDIISGIKIDRQYDCCPLFGSDVNYHKFKRLHLFTNELTFWLDYDKRAHSIKLASLAQLMGFKTRIIVTEKDPKVYTDCEIFEIVEN